MIGLGEIAFLRPQLLAAVIPWLALCLFLARGQHGALRFLEEKVSERFRPRYTAYRKGAALTRHFWLVAGLGICLTIAAAGPTIEDQTEVERDGGDVILLLDASQSMYATDLATAGEPDLDRFTAAVGVAREIVAGLPEHRFAIFTWSGAAAPEMPMTADRSLIEETLHHAEPHTIYQNPGTHFAGALDAILPFTGQGRELQVVILSDGEQPFEEDYDDALRAVVEAGVPVHGVAIGTRDGQNRAYSEVSEEEKAFKVDFLTRRIDRHLSRMAKRSGGVFTAVGDWPSEVSADIVVYAIDAYEGGLGRLDDEFFQAEKIAKDRGRFFLVLFLILYLLHGAVIGRRRREPVVNFDLDRLGPPPSSSPPSSPPSSRASFSTPFSASSTIPAVTGLFAFLIACSPSPLEMAHRENERGLSRDRAGLTELARTHFERSRAYGVMAHIPTHNLGRSLARAGQYAEAHDFFEQALQLEAEFPEARFSDGVALFEWGESERDPKDCHLERTLELFQAALGRFETFEEMAPDAHPLAADGVSNAAALRRQISEIEALIKEPPEACRESPPPPLPSSSPAPAPSASPSGAPPSERDESESESEAHPGALPPPVQGGAPPPGQAGASSSGAGGQELDEAQRQEIREALERIQADSRSEGVYHRRTKSAQWEPNVKAGEKIWW